MNYFKERDYIFSTYYYESSIYITHLYYVITSERRNAFSPEKFRYHMTWQVSMALYGYALRFECQSDTERENGIGPLGFISCGILPQDSNFRIPS